MDGYQLIWVTFLALVAGGIVIAVLSSLAIAIFGIQRRNRPLMIAGAAFASLPFIGFAWSSLRADWAYSDRKREIDRMNRHALPVGYPRAAVVLGGDAKGALEAYMLLGYLDNVRAAKSRPNGLFTLGPVTAPILPISPECRATAHGYLQTIIDDNPTHSTSYVELTRCLKEVGAEDVAVGLPDDAIMIRRDMEALNRERGRKVWSGEVVEISVRQNGKEILIDYAEKPLINKLYSPFTPLPEALETGPAPDPDSMIIRMFGLPKPSTEPNG